MLPQETIEKAQTEWMAPKIFALKKDATLCFCVDYCKLNMVTKRESHPTPRMNECVDTSGEVTVFSTRDANRGYWQVEICETDSE